MIQRYVFIMFMKCTYSTVKLMKCCIYVFYMQIKAYYLVTYSYVPEAIF